MRLNRRSRLLGVAKGNAGSQSDSNFKLIKAGESKGRFMGKNADIYDVSTTPAVGIYVKLHSWLSYFLYIHLPRNGPAIYYVWSRLIKFVRNHLLVFKIAAKSLVHYAVHT